MSLRLLVIGSVILCLAVTSQAHSQEQPLPKTRQILTSEEQLAQLKEVRYALLHVYTPSSRHIRDVDAQIRALSNNPTYKIPLQQQPRMILNRCLAELKKEKVSLLFKFKPQSPEVVSIEFQIRTLRDALTHPTRRAKSQLISS